MVPVEDLEHRAIPQGNNFRSWAATVTDKNFVSYTQQAGGLGGYPGAPTTTNNDSNAATTLAVMIPKPRPRLTERLLGVST